MPRKATKIDGHPVISVTLERDRWPAFRRTEYGCREKRCTNARPDGSPHHHIITHATIRTRECGALLDTLERKYPGARVSVRDQGADGLLVANLPAGTYETVRRLIGATVSRGAVGRSAILDLTPEWRAITSEVA